MKEFFGPRIMDIIYSFFVEREVRRIWRIFFFKELAQPVKQGSQVFRCNHISIRIVHLLNYSASLVNKTEDTRH